VTRTDDLPSYHQRLCTCDLFLDTPFYNAGSTTPTVLWAGVPVLTLAGNRTAARLAAGYMLGGGGGAVTAASQRLPNLVVARTLSEYARLMVLLARRESKGWVAVRKARPPSPPASLSELV
jgi:predicted O-linked N-acetylglucosamine transferase (SPINDLY family)